MKKLFVVLAFIFVGLMPALAQKFIIDPWGNKGAECKNVIKTGAGWVVERGNKELREFPKGFEFNSLGMDADSIYYIFECEGNYYAVKEKILKFSSNNPADAVNPLSEKVQARSSRLGEFYGTDKALNVIFIAFAIAVVLSLCYLPFRMRFLRPLFLVTIPLAMLVISLIEIVGYAMFENEVLWWCQPEQFSMWGTFGRLGLFVVIILCQLFSLKLYKRGLNKYNKSDEPYKKISVAPLAISMVIAIPLTFAVIFGLAGMGLQHEPYFDYLWAGTFVVSLGTGVVISFVRNIKRFGLFLGILIWLFLVVYIISCIVSAVVLIGLAIEFLIRVIAVVGAFFMLSFVFPKYTYRRSDGTEVEVYEY